LQKSISARTRDVDFAGILDPEGKISSAASRSNDPYSAFHNLGLGVVPEPQSTFGRFISGTTWEEQP
jgi:hypothetical protein